MKKMKRLRDRKRIIGLMAAMALLGSCMACGSKMPQETEKTENAEPEAGENNTAQGAIELEFWLVGTEEDIHYKALPAVCEAFNEANPGIKVNCVVGGASDDYHKKISLMADTNSLPDFFELEAAPGEGFMEGGVVTDITDYMQNDSEWSSYKCVDGAYDNMLKLQNGKYVGVAINASAAGWFFNKGMFEEKNLQVPDTWDELLDAVATFQDAGITPIAHGASDLWSVWGYFPMFDQYGIESMAEEIKDGSVTWADCMVGPFARIGELAAAGAYPQNTSAMTYAQALATFTDGTSPILTTGSWEAGNFAAMEDEVDFRWGFTGMPDTEFEQNVGLKGVDWYVYAGSSLKESDEKLEAGMKFLKYLCSPEANQILLEHHFTFPAYECADINSIDMDDITRTLYERLSDDAGSVGYAFTYIDGNLENAHRNSISGVISGSITPEEAARQMDDNYRLLK